MKSLNKKGNLTGKAMGLVGGIIGMVVLITIVVAIEPTATTSFNAWNSSTVLPFGSLFANGTIFWLLAAVGVIGVMFGVAKLRGQ